MRRTHHGAIARSEQHGHAIRHAYCTHLPRTARHRRIRSGWPGIRNADGTQLHNLNAMHLLQPNRLGRQPQLLPHSPPVLRNRLGRIINAGPQVQ
jgi:hypothetical protein